MEDEIKVGEYVRIAGGIIGKITNKNSDGLLIDKVIRDPMRQDGTIRDWCIFNNENRLIVKHSSNIIDLIEVKDVIHYRIDHISTTLETKGYIEGITEITDEEMLESIKENPDYHILEILTKEQWNQTAYKVKE